MSLLHQQKSFLETNAWQKPHLNSLRYNTSQVGSVLPVIYGTTRQSVNLIALGDYRGPNGGKKGKNSGPLPLSGRSTGKGGGGGKKGAGGKKSADYSVDVDFAIAQGPVDILAKARVWASAGIAFFESVGLNLYRGYDGQAPDPVFFGLGDVVGYSGTCHVTGTPMDLGQSPVLPNLSFEVTGFEVGSAGPAFLLDACPANAVRDFLTNPRYGAGFPDWALDPELQTTYGVYCQAALFAISVSLQSQTDSATWISELARLTNTAIVWSGSVLKFIPYGDVPINNNGALWEPDLIPRYSLTDDDFLPWSEHIDTADPQEGEDDPVIVTRSNPADATNWMSMEYLDRENSYNKTMIAQFDQGSIDRFGLRTESSVNGNCFCHQMSAQQSLALMLQRALYVRNTYRFQLGWQFALLEPMDIVLLTDARCGLAEQPVRITAIEENENGDLIVDAEEIKVDIAPPPTGCGGPVIWRYPTPNFSIAGIAGDLYLQNPDKLDNAGRYYITDPFATPPNVIEIYAPDGSLTELGNDLLWDKVKAFTGTDMAEIAGPGGDPTGVLAHSYYSASPILDGQYILGFSKRYFPDRKEHYAFWWSLHEPGSLDCIGAHFYTGLTAWPGMYNGNGHVLGAVSADHPILVQCYAEVPGNDTVLGVLPSVNQFKSQQYPFRIPNTMLYPVGGAGPEDTGFGYKLMLAPTGRNESMDWGFLLPAADGTPVLYIYCNRANMDGMAASWFDGPPEWVNVIQPANPLGAMVKIRLGDFGFDDVSEPPLLGLWHPSVVSSRPGNYRGRATGTYEVDNANWVDMDGNPAIPFLDEYTVMTSPADDPVIFGDDRYSPQTTVINRGGGIYWIVFYMLGASDAYWRNGSGAPNHYAHPIYERVKIFQYNQATEQAHLFQTATCILHDVDDPPLGGDNATGWESSNDEIQTFSVEQYGPRGAALYVHGLKYRKLFFTMYVPVSG